MNDSELTDVFDGIVLNDLHGKYSHLLTGYIGTPEFLKKIADVVKTLKRANPKLLFCKYFLILIFSSSQGSGALNILIICSAST